MECWLTGGRSGPSSGQGKGSPGSWGWGRSGQGETGDPPVTVRWTWRYPPPGRSGKLPETTPGWPAASRRQLVSVFMKGTQDDILEIFLLLLTSSCSPPPPSSSSSSSSSSYSSSCSYSLSSSRRHGCGFKGPGQEEISRALNLPNLTPQDLRVTIIIIIQAGERNTPLIPNRSFRLTAYVKSLV